MEILIQETDMATLSFSSPGRQVRPATMADIPAMQAMYAHSKQIMRSNGNLLQWTGNYPDMAQIRQDMEQGASFIIEETGQPVGTFAFIVGEEPTYARIEAGSWPENTPLYGTLHRIACTPGTHCITTDSIRWGFSQISCIRIDTHADNRIMQHIVEKAGFQYCGIIHVADGTPRKAYQLTRNQVIPALQAYVEQEIIPRYAAFDKAHQEEHVRHVIAQSLALAKYYPVAVNMVYAVAAYHDTGLAEGRDTHHMASGGIIRRDAQLRRWFREEEIETMAEAAEDHRASAKHEPRSIYGKIVAEADRQIETESVIRRTIQFALSTQTADNQTIDFQDQIKERCWQHTLTHLQEKYGRNGYLKLWIPESPNAENLAKLQALIDNREALAEMFEKIYTKETGGCQNR